MKILLADDSMTAQNMGKKILTEAGYEVVAVSNGAAAMKKIAAEKPDLLVLDVYMPGYSGLEVCEKVRAGAETNHTPVLLTVGQMEPYQAEDGKRVRADGVIIKPFEASDLVAAVKKLEEKLSAAAPAKAFDPEDTVLLAPAAAPEFRDPSYEEWKVSAEDHMEEAEPVSAPQFTMSEEMASAPAFGMEEMDVSAPPEAETPPPAPVPQSVMEAPSMELAAAAAATSDLMPHVAFAAEVAYEEAQPLEAAAEPAPALDPAVEFTSPPPQAEEAPIATLPELETTGGADAVPLADGRDPALVTDASEMASAFPTSFGVEGAEEVTVGVASDFPALYADEQAAVAEPEAAPEAETPPYQQEEPYQEEPVAAAPEAVADVAMEELVAAETVAAEPVAEETVAQSASFEEPPEHRFSAPISEQLLDAAAYEAAQTPAEPAPAEPEATEPDYAAAADSIIETSIPAEPEPAAPEPASPEPQADLELAAALAAAVTSMPAGDPEPEPEPYTEEPPPEQPAAAAAAAGLDAATVAAIVEKVVFRRKEELMQEILREIENAKQ